MTEDPFERRLRRDLRAIAQTADERGPASPSAPVVRERRQVRRALAVLAPLLVVPLGAVAWWIVDNADGPDVDTTVTTSQPTAPSTVAPTSTVPGDVGVDEPPPSDTGPAWIWLSHDVVSTDGTDMTFAVVDPTKRAGILYGVLTAIDRWNGETWERVTTFGSCVDHWGCWGELPTDAEPSVDGLGLLTIDGVGERERVRLEGLAEGWYRLRKEMLDEDEASGVFRVVDAVSLAETTPVEPLSDPMLRLNPPVLSTSGGSVRVSVASAGRADTVPVGPIVHARWDGATWIEMFESEMPSLTVLSDFIVPVTLHLPGLSSGSYRAVDADGNEARYWVDADIPGGSDCQTSLIQPFGSIDAGPRPPTESMRPTPLRNGWQAEWMLGDQTVRVSMPTGAVTDLLGERVVNDGAVTLWYRDDRVEAWIRLEACGGGGDRLLGLEVSGATEQENVSLALRLGHAIADRFGGVEIPVTRATCPDESTPAPETPNVVHDVWLFCRTDESGRPGLRSGEDRLLAGRPARGRGTAGAG